ncbi:ABC transporter permease [Thermodesulforhabdus norvegica]|uniref:Nucleoside ABC transporter membrane protein n=1 Tax=Thermodesulforhabdus norvegica TaxID=39841 RepID=A0A1I4V166_9BACT|nr:ABC transporter permease [Thermodesulforhabdus norvegica]SFM94974.1 nucleoside ABC transporter membrane protein [Thermodesulforhabdus norvegica]
MEISWGLFFGMIVASAAPIVIAGLGETLTEKSGVINLSLDGTILLGAMSGFVIACKTGSTAAGILGAGLAGALVAALLGLLCLLWKAPQVAVGFVLTLTCRDLAYFLGNPFSRIAGPQLDTISLPVLSKLDFIGPAFFHHNIMTYASIVLIPAVWIYLYKTRAGLILRAAGENPEACRARGYKVLRIRFFYLVLGGLLAGMAGAMFSLGIKPGWGRPQGSEGIGWIVLALVIFGGWNPLRVALGAYIFATLQALSSIVQNIWTSVPAQLIQVAPFPLMILTLVFINRPTKPRLREPTFRFLELLKARPPAALGKAFSEH